MGVFGRESVLRAGEGAWEAASLGAGRLLLVAGEAGIGKTTVARVLAGRAAADGAIVRWGAAWEGQGAMPLAIWVDCLRRPGGDRCSAVASRLQDGGFEPAVEGDGGRGLVRFCAEVIDALAEVSAAAPQLLVLEDLHWVDPLSLHLLTAVAAHAPAMPILVVATYREDELPAGGSLGAIGGNAERHTLTGLGVEWVGSLLGDVCGRAISDDEARSVHHDTGGNPLFVTEVGRLLAAGSRLHVPSGVRTVLDRRLARLSSGCHRALGAASVLGVAFGLPTLAAVLDEPPEMLAAALDEAARSRLVTPEREDPSRWSFVHALVRDARYEALGTAERADLHRRVVDVVAPSGAASAGLLAHHVVRGTFEVADSRPAEILSAAAREAVAHLAADEAVRLAEQAVRLAPAGPTGDELRAAAWLVAGDAHLRRDDPDAAAGSFESAAAVGRALERPDLIAGAALGFAAGLGSFEVRILDQRQVDMLEEAAATLAPDSPLLSLVLARLSVALSFVGSDERRLTLADSAVDAAQRAGDMRALAAAIAARCDAIAGPDHVDERLAASTEVIKLARRAGDLPLELLGRRLRVVALLERRRLSDVDAEIRAFARTARRLDDPLFGWYVPMWEAMGAFAAGSLEDARRLAAVAGETGRGAGSTNAALLEVTLATFDAIIRRDGDAFDSQWDEITAIHPEFVSIFALPTLALGLAACGRVDEARTLLERSGLVALDALARDQEWLTALAQLISASVLAGHDPVARRAYELARPYAGLGVFEGIAAVDHGVVDRFLALAAGYLGDADAARLHARAALEGIAGSGRLVVAETRSDCARALQGGDEDDRARAAELARAAADEYLALGLKGRAEEIGPLAAGAAGGGPRAAAPAADPARAAVHEGPVGTAVLTRDGDTWVFTYGDISSRIRHAKGIGDLAVLLARPGRDLHVRELEVAAGAADRGASSDPVLDQTAIARYRQRLHDLQDDLDEADRHADAGRAARLAAERDALVDELTRAVGPGSRRRAAGPDPDERLRKAVSARIKATIERLDGLHPRLARHLRSSVRTGYWCRYEPEQPTEWSVNRSP